MNNKQITKHKHSKQKKHLQYKVVAKVQKQNLPKKKDAIVDARLQMKIVKCQIVEHKIT